MDKPEEGKTPPAGNKPPHPPPPAKKPGAVPKGPVPPRGQTAMPRMPGAPSPAPGGASTPKPPMPPMGARPPMPGGAAPQPPSAGLPPKPPAPPSFGAPGAPPPMAPMSPSAAAVDARMKETEGVKSDLEQKVSELEKRLLEEREKVLLASLRSKEEEAISVKVETSLKDIQDKLRRERKEQELEESRRKAENRVMDMERRLAEERETWVATLKGQLNQRDSITQEMETHFSARLKDLEYRWSQEKSALEAAVRDREADMVRLRHEFALKTDQEKAYWEDRFKVVAGEKEKVEREFERSKDRFLQEKEGLVNERQMLRDQVMRLEHTSRFIEDQNRGDKTAIAKWELEAKAAVSQLTDLKGRLDSITIERDGQRQKIAALEQSLQNHIRQSIETDAQLKTMSAQLEASRGETARFDMKTAEKDRIIENLKAEAAQVRQQLAQRKDNEDLVRSLEGKMALMKTQLDEAMRAAAELQRELTSRRKEYEQETEELSRQLSRAKNGSREEVTRAQMEGETRIRTLQARLDWYDANAKREYAQAREKVQEEILSLESQLKEAAHRIQELTAAGQSRSEIEEERLSLAREVERVRTDWKQAQWELENKLRETVEHLKAEVARAQQADEARIALEQELRQVRQGFQFNQSVLQQRQDEMNRLAEAAKAANEANALAQEKARHLEQQLAGYREIAQGRGLPDLEKLEAEVQEKARALEQARESVQKLTGLTRENDKKMEVFAEKEKVFRQALDEKEESIEELRAKISSTERRMNEMKSDLDSARQQSREEVDRAQRLRQEELTKLQRQKQEEIELAKRNVAEEVERRVRAEMPPPGPSVQQLEASLRQQIEEEYAGRNRDQESDIETRINQVRDELKRDLEKAKQDVEIAKEEARKMRDARSQIEREASELLQAAEEHFKGELERQLAEAAANNAAPPEPPSGIFGRIGKFLDTPVIDLSRKKKDEIPEETEE